MRTTIDASGRLVVPAAIRRRLGLLGGGEVELDETDGVMRLVPVSVAVEIDRADGVPLARTLDPVPPLTDEVVRATLEQIRR